MARDPAHTETLRPGLVGHANARVTDDLTAPVVGSGTVAVLATPALIVIMEKAALDCAERRLAPGEASLGVYLDVSHTAPTPPGDTVSATATLTEVDGRKLTFEIEARDGAGPVGKAVHTRIVVDVARFMRKLAARTP